jgi:hypothetical protein
MQEASIGGLVVGVAFLLSACGGGGHPSAPTSTAGNFDFQAGVRNMVKNGLAATVALSGTVAVNGTATDFTGSGTFTRAVGVSATFEGAAAVSQLTTIAGTVSAAGRSAPYSTSVTDFYSSGDGAFLGEASGNEYEVAQAPIAFPTSIVGGSSGVLGTLSRYTDDTLSVPIGTVQESYATLSPVDPGSPIGIAVTTKIYDSQNALIETDVTNYTLTSSGLISLGSASAKTSSGMLTVSTQ